MNGSARISLKPMPRWPRELAKVVNDLFPAESEIEFQSASDPCGVSWLTKAPNAIVVVGFPFDEWILPGQSSQLVAGAVANEIIKIEDSNRRANGELCRVR